MEPRTANIPAAIARPRQAGPAIRMLALWEPDFGLTLFHPARLRSLTGIYEMQQTAFDAVDPLRVRSAFPSLHCSIGLLTLFYAWRFGDALFPGNRRLYFWMCLPLVVSLWLSTIYLRHHWVPDIAAGLALGLASATLAPGLRRARPRVTPAAG